MVVIMIGRKRATQASKMRRRPEFKITRRPRTMRMAWQSPVEWYPEASTMLGRVRGERNGDANRVREAFEGSGNPVLDLSTNWRTCSEEKPPNG
jgi:hypothetical protein